MAKIVNTGILNLGGTNTNTHVVGDGVTIVNGKVVDDKNKKDQKDQKKK
ncbi:hypothetical protein ACFWZ7_26215 [Nocardiopsis alba]